MALKILLADDSMTAQNMGKKILADAGYDVVAVSNGAAAIKKIASDRPDIIILDVYMPGYTGLEVCERVKAASETARTPVLLTVGKMEPFKAEEANRVKADGVMIKPFEATDLIAAVQSIGSRLLGGAPPPPQKSQDTALRIPPPPLPPLAHAHISSKGDTLRIPAPHAGHATGDTLPIAPPINPESTVRLTAEQVKAFQDATYKDWMASTDEHTATASSAVSHSFVKEAAPEIAVAAPPMEQIEVKQEIPVLEGGPEEPAIPVLSESVGNDDGLIARAMGDHEIFTVDRHASASPLVTELPEEPEIALNTSVIYEPAATTEVEAESTAQPFFALEPERSTTFEPAEPAVVMSPAEVAAEAPVVGAVEHELETSGPVELIPAVLPQLEELEPTIAPAMEVVAQAAPELEINSPVHLQPHVVAGPDPALITNDEGEMSQFATKFGVDRPEEISVGIASELPPEQLAAITMPMVAEEPSAVEFAAADVEVAHTSVMDEVGDIESQSPMMSQEVVAYVPGYDDTQRFVPAAILPSESGKMEVAEVAPPIVEPVAESIPEPTAAIEPEIVSAVATEHEEPVAMAQAEQATPVMEAAAAVAGVTVAAGAAYFVSHHETVQEPELSEPEVAAEVEPPTEIAAEPVAVAAPAREPVGDAALAEELAAALAKSESEPPPETEAVVASAMDPAVAEAVESVTRMGETHNWSDTQLSEAVARAIERLKPQLIDEILKQLTK